MAKQNRETLKQYFGSGQRPTAENFKDFIESTVNILDDNISEKKNPGIKVAADGMNRDVISIFKKSGEANPEWTVSVDDTGDLVIRKKKADQKFQSSIVFKDNGDIELNGKNTLITGGRKGAMIEPLPADGKWHNVTGALYGINALEITASYSTGSGRHNVLVAWAVHCFGRKRKITQTRPYAFFWNNKLKLRWIRVKDENGKRTKCILQIKTRYNCGKSSEIQCSVTQLWNHSDMPE